MKTVPIPPATRSDAAFGILNAAPRGKVWLEVFAWGLIALLFAGFFLVFRPMPLADDSYQYLNVADNVNHGLGIVTSFVHFDVERSHGRMPAPVTTFPPAYPLAIAVLSRLLGHIEGTARAVALVCYAGTAALLTWALILTGVTTFVRQIISFAFVTNAVTLAFGTAVLSEPIFMLVPTGAVTTLILVERAALSKHAAIACAVIAYTLVGASYWIRYAGLFLIVGVLGYTLLQFLLQRNRLRTVFLFVGLIPIALTGALMLRNVALAGTWKGGNEMTVYNPARSVAANYIRPSYISFWVSIQLSSACGNACC